MGGGVHKVSVYGVHLSRQDKKGLAMAKKPLTPKQEAFAQAVADGMTQSDAYRSAYDTKTKSETLVAKEASLLMANRKISVRVKDLKAKLEAKALWTREDSVNALKRIVALALDAEAHAKVGDGVNAVQALNKMHGYDAPTKLEHSGGVGVQVVAVADMSAVLGDASSPPD